MINIDEKDLNSVSFLFGLTKISLILILIILILGESAIKMNVDFNLEIYYLILNKIAYVSLISLFISIYMVLKIIVDAFNSLK